ncbi:MAG: FtsX-like permease family protein [Polyangiaceae bacterium]|nr:FtsX-like permease family protein [Polyangiaceae bacterium]
MRTLFAAIRLSLRAIGRAKVRASLTILGILIGVAAVVVVVALGNAVRDQVIGQINSLGANIIFVFPQDSRSSGARTQPRARLTEDDAAAILREATSVSAVSVHSSTSAQLVAGDRNFSTQVMGVGENYLQIKGFTLSEGSMFSPIDFRTKAKVIILGQTVRKELFGASTDVIGEYVRIGKYPFRVVGLLSEKGQSPFGEDQDNRVIMPIGAFRARVLRSPPGRVQMLLVQSSDDQTVDRATTQIEGILRQRHKIAAEDPPDFGIRTQAEIRKSNEETFATLTALLSSVAAISLLVGGIGVMNVMLVSVTERTREIGIRMAIGARQGDILIQFLIEAIVLCLVGGLLGLALGLGSIALLAKSLGWPFVIPASAIVASLVTSAFVGIVFGFLPARRASNLDPIDALRYE